MPTHLEILVSFQWRKVEADGSKCRMCGENIFLAQFDAVVFINGKEILGPEGIAASVCQSCWEACQQ